MVTYYNISLIIFVLTGTVEVSLPFMQAEVDKIRYDLGQLLHSIAPLIKSAIPSLDDLKILLKRCCPEVKPQLSIAKSFDDVMEVIEEKCSIVNISIMEAVVKFYSINEAADYILAYKTQLEEFCEINICNVQLKKLSSSLLTCNTIKFIVNWEVTKCTLSAVKGLLWKAFQDFDKRVEVVALNEVNSIAIICYAPHHLMDSLLLTAQDNLETLIELGLIQLTIGYYTVYDKCTKDKVLHYLINRNVSLLKQKLKSLEEKVEYLENKLFSAEENVKKLLLEKEGN